ncbi:MAG: DNA repair protein RadA [Bacteroidetes bacterium]|nr:DNA repair protein RadA [Bacteroidota bacterium]MBU1719727.1 DNA repair protein RadA [Bacteroidota bacterium]
MDTKKCKFCGEEIIGKRTDAVFCSNTCKAKHWEEQKLLAGKSGKALPEKTDVTTQLRGVLGHASNKTAADTKEKTTQRSLDKIVSMYNELRAPLDEKIRRLTDVKMQTAGRIEKLRKELENELQSDGSKWILGMAGTGALLGRLSSEDKTQGTILGGSIGLVGGSIMKMITTDQREAGKRTNAKKKHAEIRRLTAELRRQEDDILKVQEEIKALPLLQKKDVILHAPSGSIAQPNDVELNTDIINETRPYPVTQDVSDVCLTDTNSEKIINSHDLKSMDFKVLDFRGKWSSLFGLPSVNFHCIIHGRPGEGKSTFAIQFAKYLAENIGRVVYISGEEGFTKTLRDKFMNNDGVSKYLDIADLRTSDEIISNILPEIYNFIFIDSLDNMRIDAEKMKKIRERYKNSALITISQSTKDGKIRGSQELVHDCDISVMVENGIAKTNKNRFKEKWMTVEVFRPTDDDTFLNEHSKN